MGEKTTEPERGYLLGDLRCLLGDLGCLNAEVRLQDPVQLGWLARHGEVIGCAQFKRVKPRLFGGMAADCDNLGRSRSLSCDWLHGLSIAEHHIGFTNLL